MHDGRNTGATAVREDPVGGRCGCLAPPLGRLTAVRAVAVTPRLKVLQSSSHPICGRPVSDPNPLLPSARRDITLSRRRHGSWVRSYGKNRDMSAWIAVITVLAGILAGGVVTYATTRSQLRIEAEHAYDRALRDLRLPHYQELFHLTRSMPREFLEFLESPRRSDLVDFREDFHNWFFSEKAGGMFLSQEARKFYFHLQNELQSVAGRMQTDSELVCQHDSEILRKRASDLRHQLTTGLGRAERPRLGWIGPRSIPPPSQHAT
jgi:hypothetical protein